MSQVQRFGHTDRSADCKTFLLHQTVTWPVHNCLMQLCTLLMMPLFLLHMQNVLRDATRLSSGNESLQASRKCDVRMFCPLAARANGT